MFIGCDEKESYGGGILFFEYAEDIEGEMRFHSQ